MKNTKRQIIAVLMLLIVSNGSAVGQTPFSRNSAEGSEVQLSNPFAKTFWAERPSFNLMPSSRVNVRLSAFSIAPTAAGPNLTVLGGGTVGRLTKWTGITSSNSFIGDSTIFEDKFGKVGIGTELAYVEADGAGVDRDKRGGGWR